MDKEGCANIECNDVKTLNLFEGKYYCLSCVSPLVKARNEKYDSNLQDALNKRGVEL